MTQFEKVLRSIIKASGGNPDTIALADYMERFSHAFAFSPANYWLGVAIMKNPLDLAVLQQILYEKRPKTIIECGTAHGGSAYYLACMMDILAINGKVFTIDHEQLLPTKYKKNDIVKVNNSIMCLQIEQSVKPKHKKIHVIEGDCMRVEIPEHHNATMVILDCHHSERHVTLELEKYAAFVSIGQYLIVEDTDARGLQGGGPAVAVAKFLKKNKNFVVDKQRAHYGISSNIGGYLLRIS